MSDLFTLCKKCRGKLESRGIEPYGASQNHQKLKHLRTESECSLCEKKSKEWITFEVQAVLKEFLKKDK